MAKKSEDERYRSIFEYSAVPLWEVDIERLRGVLSEMRARGIADVRAYLEAHPEFLPHATGLTEVTNVNEAAVRLYGVESKKPLLGPLSLTFSPPDDVTIAATKAMIAAVADETPVVESEITITTVAGNRLSVMLKAHVPRRDDPYPFMLVSLIDVTARKEAEQRESRNAGILRSIIDASPDPIFVKDTSLRMVLCNVALARNIGKEPHETYGKSDIENGWSADLVKGNPGKGIVGWEKDDLAVLSGETIEVEDQPSDFDKGIRYYRSLKFPLRSPDGTIIGLVGIGNDVTEKRRQEAELRASEELYRGLIEQAADGIIELSPEGTIIGANAAFGEMLGYSQSELDGKSILDTYSDELRSEGTRRLKALAVGQVLRFSRPLKRKDGSFIQVETSMRRLERGSILEILHDITKRMQDEAALAWERRLFDVLMENIPDYIYFKDVASRFIRTTQSHALALGLKDPSEAVGKTDADFYGADHAAKALEDERKVIATGEPLVDMEERETYPSHPDTWAITSKMPFRNAKGVIIGTFGITHDITGRKHLEERNQMLATLVESADDAIVGIDLDRRITVWNGGAERMYGYPAGEVIGTATSRLIPPELEEEARLIRERVVNGEPVEHFETTRLRRDGSRIDVSLTLSAIRDASGKIVGMASVARDVTEQKAVQAQLFRAQRLESLATLAAGVAHQFNNINTVVGGYLQMMQMEKKLPERIGGYLAAAMTGLQRAVDITDRLLALTGAAGGSTEGVRLDDMARAIVAAYGHRIDAEKVRVVLALGETPPVHGDESRVKFVLSSLVGNALDSLVDRPERVATIRTGCTKDAAFFEVEDSGCGIPEADMLRIFSPFHSAKGEWAPTGSPQAKLKGVGLSLAISSTTVSEYGGRIDVQSTPGVGSTFRVVLPLVATGS